MAAFGCLPRDVAAVLQGREPQWLFAGPVAGDAPTLAAELARLDAKIDAITSDSDRDLQCGLQSLFAMKKTAIRRATARHERCLQSIETLHAHECEQARARYVTRCRQLKHDMSEDIQREIRRLKQTRDGVSVMDRRRLTRNSGGGVNGSAGGGNSSSSSSGGYMETPGYYVDTSMDGTSSTNGGGGGAIANADELASPSAMQLAEKKRLVVLLSATPIFRPLNKTISMEAAQDDLALINQTQRSCRCRQSTVATDTTTDHSEEEGEEEAEQEQSAEKEEESPARPSKRQRLAFHPRRLPEGQSVVVVTADANESDEDHTDNDGSPTPTDAKVLATGVVTAATKRHVYLLSSTGHAPAFQTIDISDWTHDRIAVYAVDTVRGPPCDDSE